MLKMFQFEHASIVNMLETKLKKKQNLNKEKECFNIEIEIKDNQIKNLKLKYIISK